MVLTTQSTLQSIQSFFKLFHQSIILANTQWGQISWSGLSSGVNIFSWFFSSSVDSLFLHFPQFWEKTMNVRHLIRTQTFLYLWWLSLFFCLFPPGLSEVKCQLGVMTWAAPAQTLSQETDNLPRAAASWAEAERPKWEKPQTLNILSTTNFKF